MRNRYIGVFDSGLGGLSTLKGIVKELPQYNYIYLGDTARVPYGNRSRETVYEFTKQAVDFLFKNGCELIVFACFTASSDALRKIQREYLPRQYPNKRVLGVLIPVAEAVAKKTAVKNIGIIATESTAASGAFERELLKLNPDVRIHMRATPLLVPIVEAGEEKTEAAQLILKKYLSPLLDQNIDTLILGCTHYGILKPYIRRIVGRNVTVVESGSSVPRRLKSYLEKHAHMEKKIGRNGIVRFYTTDLSPRFEALGSEFFGKPIKVRKISLL